MNSRFQAPCLIETAHDSTARAEWAMYSRQPLAEYVYAHAELARALERFGG